MKRQCAGRSDDTDDVAFKSPFSSLVIVYHLHSVVKVNAWSYTTITPYVFR